MFYSKENNLERQKNKYLQCYEVKEALIKLDYPYLLSGAVALAVVFGGVESQRTHYF